MKGESEGGGLGRKEEDLVGRASEYESETDLPVPLGAPAQRPPIEKGWVV